MEAFVRDTFWMIYRHPLKDMMIFGATCIVLWGVLGLASRYSPWWKRLNALMAICITGAIVFVTLLARNPGTHEVIIRPFNWLIEARRQKEVYRSTLMNVMLFLPLGLSLPNLLHRRPVLKTVLFGLCLSAAVEGCQYWFALGRCEVDDLIMNTLGTFLGALSFCITDWRR